MQLCFNACEDLIMTVYDFKLWLLNNGYTQKSLAKRLCITEQTITKYNGNGRYPVIFCLALKALEGETK